MKPLIVLVTTDQETNAQLSKLGVGLLEMRVDLFSDCSLSFAIALFQQRRQLKVPLLLTVRNDKKEGAQSAMTDTQKWALLEGLLPLCEWVDIELSSQLCLKTIRLARSFKKKVIVSAHDFKATPAKIEVLYRQAKTVKADAVKFAFFAKDEIDLLRLIEFTRDHKKEPVITMSVGPLGPLSRLVLPAFGSRWVYTFLNNPTAPGQMDIKTLKRLMSLASC